MIADSSSAGWLLLLAQLPSSPSSSRVALWRRLRARGAAGILNGAWVLPDDAAHQRFFEQTAQTVLMQGGKAFVFEVPRSAPEVDAMIVTRFRADRAREYDELAERCAAFLAELDKESRAGKFIFAELEENEQDLEKLVRWLAKIRARDFFPDQRRAASDEVVARCRAALEVFSRAAYEAEDVQERSAAAAPGTATSGDGAAADPAANCGPGAARSGAE